MPAAHPKPIDFVKALQEAQSLGLLAHDKEETARGLLTGFSGTKLIGALQRLARLFEGDETACYLEIGVFQGLTLNSVAAANPRLRCFGVDNFAFFDPRSENLRIVEERIAALHNTNAELVNADFEDALESLARWIGTLKVAVYFVDGPHDYRSQLMCLELALPHLHEHAVVVVDDANYEHVRQANADFLRVHTDWRLVAQAYTPAHPKNLSGAARLEAQRGWWNGVNVLCRTPTAKGKAVYPPTKRDRSRFEDDHFVHPHRMAPFVKESLRLTGAIARGEPLKFSRELVRITRKIQRGRNELGRFDTLNTWSSDLPAFEISAKEE